MLRVILHLDMNSYFASVEQQANPFFRDKPVGVCAYLSENGCIIASSIEAKKLGIKTGCRVYEAKQIYPKVILVENDPNKYRAVTRKLFSIMSDYSSNFEPYSIDEAFLDLTGYVGDFIEAEKIAEQIRQRVKIEIGEWLKCSIGVSYTKFLAKSCSDLAKPDQTKVFTPADSFEGLYGNTKLTDAWGINAGLEKKLNNLGIYNLLDFKKYPVQNLMQVIGKQGYFLWAKINGKEIEEIKNNEAALSKSIGHSYCLPKKTADKGYLSGVLFKLAEKTGRRLRERGQQAHGLYIRWSYVSRLSEGKIFKLKTPVFSTEEIFFRVCFVLKNYSLKDKVRMLAVGVFNLTEPSRQLDLFEDKKSSNGLITAMDEINSRYGGYAVYRGTLWKTQELAKDRIGFRKIDGV